MRRLVIGLGNDLRGDDGAGCAVARLVENADTVVRSTASYDLMDVWEGAEEVIVVDAMRSRRPPGTVLIFDAARVALPNRGFASTHAIGIAETIEMARTLNRLPQRLVVYGIEAGDVSAGATLSAKVEQAIARVAREIDHA